MVVVSSAATCESADAWGSKFWVESQRSYFCPILGQKMQARWSEFTDMLQVLAEKGLPELDKTTSS